MIPNNLIKAASFNPKSLQFPNAWMGHLHFASWVVQEVCPKILVELGTHSGNSYFSFCQSVAETGISSKCYAVDTWQGDEHAGQYRDSIFTTVDVHNQENYAGFSRLLRMTFDDAAAYFTDESVELLHIDGLHTYDAVRHDFETWLPKLSSGAVVIFHDTNVRERGFGVCELWEELQVLYPNNLEFLHSNGLGVLQLNNTPEDKWLGWLRPNSPDKQRLKDYFASLGARQLDHFELIELKQHIGKLNKAAASHETHIANLNQAVAKKDGLIASLNISAVERDAQIANLHQACAIALNAVDEIRESSSWHSHETHIANLNQAVAKKDGLIASLNISAVERDAQIANLHQACAIALNAVDEIRESSSWHSHETHIANLNQAVAKKDGLIASLNISAVERDAQIANLHQACAIALNAVDEIRESSSWHITAPFRFISSKGTTAANVIKLLPRIILFGGGLSRSAKKAWRVFSREGWNGVRRRILFVSGNNREIPISTMRSDLTSAAVDRNDYAEWVRRHDTLTDADREKIKSRISSFPTKPIISVVMPVYNAPISYLEKAIQSVRNQLYANWELCISDDASTNPAVREVLDRHCREDRRIKVVFREKNGHISRASNSALELVQGEFIALLDHDDLLSEHALFWVVDTINQNPNVGLVYSDEDKVNETNRRYDPYFKCDLNYELLLAQNMICHFGVYRTSLIKGIGGFREGFEGAQDYDLVLRVIEKLNPEQVIHIPRVLYHWRAIVGSTALWAGEKNYAAEAGRKAVTEHLERIGISAIVTPAPEAPSLNRVRFSCPSPHPLVSIIIPTRDRADLLGMCLDSLIRCTTYPNYEVIIIDNGSVEIATQQLFDRLPQDRFRILRDESPFNFSVLNNKAARLARGELLCLMNNDIEILTPDWLEELVSFASRPDVGCVGARLWYPDGRLQHGGCVLGLGGVCGHSHKYLRRGDAGYFGRAVLHQSFSAVTAACLLVRRDIFEEVGGLDEQLGVAFNDIDFCLRVRDAGYRNVWTPYAEMNHHESASRGIENTHAKQERFSNEVKFVRSRWGGKLLRDPAYSPNLTLDIEDFSYAWPPRVNST